MNVLIIGYGKIGRIKAFIWQSLGRKVAVYDVDAQKRNQAKSDGFSLYEKGRLYDNLIVDISTPASFHLVSLAWTLEHVKPVPRSVLIEKPLASNEAELKAMHTLLAKPEMADFRDRIVVNESYYLSVALKLVTEDIAKRALKIREVNAELSKNRLPDVANGRFVDTYLGSLGIELPHMLAMVQALGFRLADLDTARTVIYKADRDHNEGFVTNILANGTSITLKSFLGDFRVDDQSVLPNLSVIRSLEVKTNARNYLVSFDPVEGLERYKAQVTIFDHKTGDSDTVIVDDDHLAANLKKLHNHLQVQPLDTLLGVSNSLEISRFIFGLRKNAQRQDTASLKVEV